MRVKNFIKQQSGLVSVSVTLVIMIIVTLVVSSFALIVRREQRRALDRQLNTQAFAAAEAGVKDAQAALSLSPSPIPAGGIKNCTGTGSFIDEVNKPAAGGTFKSNVSDNVSYSCVLIDTQLKSWEKSPIPSNGTVAMLNASSQINSLRFSWQGSDGSDTYNYGGTFPQTGLGAPLLRITIIPGIVAGTNRDSLKNNTQTLFLAPNAGAKDTANSISYVTGADDPEQGAIVKGECNTDNKGATINSKTADFACNVDVTSLNRNNYIVVIKPLYESASVSVRAFGGGPPVSELVLSGSQAEIDVTGKAADVLRRIRVRVPIGANLNAGSLDGLIPDAAISTTDSICKLFKVTNTSVENDCNTNPPNPPNPPNPDPVDNGNAQIGDFPPRQGQAPKDMDFDFVLLNFSRNRPGVVTGCSWDFGDRSGVVNLPANQCDYNDQISHTFPNTRSLIERTNGRDGCYVYRVTLTMRFSNSPAQRDTALRYVPKGQADDAPNGICYGKFKTAP